ALLPALPPPSTCTVRSDDWPCGALLLTGLTGPGLLIRRGLSRRNVQKVAGGGVRKDGPHASRADCVRRAARAVLEPPLALRSVPSRPGRPAVPGNPGRRTARRAGAVRRSTSPTRVRNEPPRQNGLRTRTPRSDARSARPPAVTHGPAHR